MVRLAKADNSRPGKKAEREENKLRGRAGRLPGLLRHALTAALVAYLAFALFRYLDTHVPEGVPEVWHARILDAALRTNGKIILTLNDLGVPGGVTWWTRKMVDLVLTTLISGSPWGLGSDPDLKITDTTYDGVSVRVYEPRSLDNNNRRPALVYYHGGGWTWLSIDVYDPTIRHLAKTVPLVVVSVGYRQSPEHPHPLPLDDCLKVTNYVINQAATMRLDSSRVAISGDSAGGQLTAAVSLHLKKKIKIQIPIYPCLQLFDLQTPSYIENRIYIPGMLNDVSMLSYWLNYGNISYEHMGAILANRHTSPALKRSRFAGYVDSTWYIPEHIRTPSLRARRTPAEFGDEALSAQLEKTILDPYFAPLMASDDENRGLPHTYILTAGHDVLRDDGLIYAQRLRSVGVKVHLAHYTEGFHGMIFFFDGPIAFDIGKLAMKDLTDYLRTHL